MNKTGKAIECLHQILEPSVREQLEEFEEEEDELLSLYGCARKLKVPVKWLKQAAIKGEVPCLQIGKNYMRFSLIGVKKAMLRIASSTYQSLNY